MAEVGDKRKIIRTYEFMSALRSTLSTVCLKLLIPVKVPEYERERERTTSLQGCCLSQVKNRIFTADHLAI